MMNLSFMYFSVHILQLYCLTLFFQMLNQLIDAHKHYHLNLKNDPFFYIIIRINNTHMAWIIMYKK